MKEFKEQSVTFLLTGSYCSFFFFFPGQALWRTLTKSTYGSIPPEVLKHGKSDNFRLKHMNIDNSISFNLLKAD